MDITTTVLARLQRKLALHHLHHLAVHVMPFGEPQIGEEVVSAPAAQFGAREMPALLGVNVDLLTPGDLPAKFRAEVLAEARPV